MNTTSNPGLKLYALLSSISGLPNDKINPEMPIFGRGLGLDSVSGTVLMAALEHDFGVTLDDIDIHMEALDSVGALTAFLHNTESVTPDWEQLLTNTATAARLKEGRAGVERVLAAVLRQPGQTSRDLAALCSLPTPTVSALRKEMEKAGLLIMQSPGARLTELGTQIAKGLALHLVPTERGEGAYGRFAQHALFPELVSRLTPLLAQRPSADTALDQAKCLPQTTAARALLALEYGALATRRIALVGDDDFTSIGLALLGKMLQKEGANSPERITVVDLDERILAVIRDLAVQHQFPIKTVKHDMRHPIPNEIAGENHAFFTDPPYTTPGASLFMTRGSELCQPVGCMAFFSFASKGPNDMLAVQRALLQLGLLIREVLPGFNRYEGASLWGNQSQMLVCEGVEHVPSPLGAYSGPLYTAELRLKKPQSGDARRSSPKMSVKVNGPMQLPQTVD